MRDVLAAEGRRLLRQLAVALPLPGGAVGVRGRGRGVGDARRRHHACGTKELVLRSSSCC